MRDFNLNKAVEWPYPVNYGKENEVDADVLILGGGVAGCHAAISAAKRGAKVVVVEKGAVIRSGSGGAGVDHWHGALHESLLQNYSGRNDGVNQEVEY